MVGRKINSLICVAAAGVLLAAPGGGHAEDNEISPRWMEEVVVTGSRIEEQITRVPANITVITEQDIRASNAKSVPEILRYQEGVVVRDMLGTGRTAQVDIRGFGETGASNTLVLVDGRRVNPIDMSNINWAQIPIDQIERIEILRGTGTVLYGDSAVGGVINIITKPPDREFSASTAVTAGSFGRHREQVSVSGGQGSLALSGNFSYDSTGGYRENNHYRATNAGGRLRYEPTDALNLHVDFGYHSDVYGMPGALNQIDYLTNRRSATNPLDSSETDDSYLRMGMESAVGDFGTFFGELSYRRINTKSDWVSIASVTENDIETFGFTPRFVFDHPLLSRANTFIIGADLYRSDQSYDLFALSTRDTIDRTSIGIYATNETELFENIFFSMGARTEKVKDDIQSLNLGAGTISQKEKLEPRKKAFNIGLSYLYKEDSSVFMKTNRSFRFPLTDEMVQLGGFGINTDLKPQTGRHYDLGVRHAFNSRLHGQLTLFRAEIKNEIFYNPAGGPFGFGANENHPETRRHGIETGLRAVVLDNLTLRGNYTYQKAKFEDDPYIGNYVPAVPRHKVVLGLRISDLPVPGIGFSADYTVVGSSYLISDQANRLDKLERYSLVDARISYRKNFIEAFVGVDNLLDKKYAQYGAVNWAGAPNFYPAPERTWTAGVEVRF